MLLWRCGQRILGVDPPSEMIKRHERAQSSRSDWAKILLLFCGIDCRLIHYFNPGFQIKRTFCSRLRNVFISSLVWMFTRFWLTENATARRKELGPRLGWGCFGVNGCFLYCYILRTLRVQNNMFTFRSWGTKTGKSEPDASAIHSWAMRKFSFDLISCKLSLSAPTGWLYIQTINKCLYSSTLTWK